MSETESGSFWAASLRGVEDFVCGISGLPPLENFKLSYLFSRSLRLPSTPEIESYFNCGCQRTTPDLTEVSSDWPRPWFYLRMFVFGLAVLLGFAIGCHVFLNFKMMPGLFIVGAFFVPLTCVALFFEFNVLRNISLYQILKFILGGGIVSLIVALLLYSITGSALTFLGATAAGIVEETAKVLAAVFLIRKTLQYKWILNGLLVGAAVGAGFAGFESAGYIFEASFDGRSALYSTLVMRAFFSPFCHVVWTACVVGALWRVKKDQPFRLDMFLHKDFLRIFVFVIFLHMLWNSGLLFNFPSNSFLLKFQFILWLVSFVGSWHLALLLVKQGLLQVKNAKLQIASAI